ncbi:MAG TPA: methylmalonyl Co-A mutase-associated GTPase MeaB [Chitinophagaceae bacterium]|nr:methylmalonyl Co-A mutase-associated GTPase MeaB [Chitinophagaceae bacterium]
MQDFNTFKKEILKGNIVYLSRAITYIESTLKKHQDFADNLLEGLLPYTGNAIRIGITGVPGVGKSTFIESFGIHLINKGYKVAVLAIDPSSQKTFGSILGDKTRMEKLSANENAFIRPTPSGTSLGGLAYKTREACLLCEAAGYDIILIETVGVGQSEIEVANISDIFMLLMLAGAGDELQGIKRGIMEMCDIMLITKADEGNENKAKAARNEYAKALHFLPAKDSGWKPQVHTISSYKNIGLEKTWDSIESFINTTKNNGYFYKNRESQNILAFTRIVDFYIKQHFFNQKETQSMLEDFEKQIANQEITPYNAAKKLIKNIFNI